MKIAERSEGKEERRVLTGMIVAEEVVARVSDFWTGEQFRSKWANLIGDWCVLYYRKHGRPPRSAIERAFEAWASKGQNEATVQIVDKFLRTLDREYKDEDTSDLPELAIRHFNRVRQSRLAEQLHETIDPERAQDLVATFSWIEASPDDSIDVLNDQSAVHRAFDRTEDPLIVYPGALGRFFGSSLERDALISFMAPEKRGKTFWLLDIVWRAMLQRRRVAFFQVGDLSEEQIMLRMLSRAARHPTRDGGMRFPMKVQIPTSVKPAKGKEVPDMDWDTLQFAAPLTANEGWEAFRRKARWKRKSPLRLSCHPNSSINVEGIRSILRGWEKRYGWQADVVVIDYADILAPPRGMRGEPRDQINETWKQMRGLSQSQRCLVVTATQSDSASYSTSTLTRRHFSDDKRKLAHVSGMVGINATEAEKKVGVQRLNWIVRREGAFSESWCVHVAGSLAIASPALCSSF